MSSIGIVNGLSNALSHPTIQRVIGIADATSSAKLKNPDGKAHGTSDATGVGKIGFLGIAIGSSNSNGITKSIHITTGNANGVGWTLGYLPTVFQTNEVIIEVIGQITQEINIQNVIVEVIGQTNNAFQTNEVIIEVIGQTTQKMNTQKVIVEVIGQTNNVFQANRVMAEVIGQIPTEFYGNMFVEVIGKV